jgi:DNA-binding transcriptional MocR family regulator
VKVGGDDGINLWVPVADEAATLVRLASQGIAVAPGVPFFSAPEHQGHIRVTIAAITPKHDHIVQRVADAAASVGSWTRAR